MNQPFEIVDQMSPSEAQTPLGTIAAVIPTLLIWPESWVVYDIKGENWSKTAGFGQEAGQVCLKFSRVEVGNGSRFNWLAEVRIFIAREGHADSKWPAKLWDGLGSAGRRGA